MATAVIAKDNSFIAIALNQLVGFISGTLVTPIGLIGFTLAYYDARVRKEAFDLHLLMQQEQQAVTAAAAASGSVNV
jgi:hypothetical protein